MICRSCGTEIAEKALICYRCGTATTEAKFKPVSPTRRSSLSRASSIIVMALVECAVYAGVLVGVSAYEHVTLSDGLANLIALTVTVIVAGAFGAYVRRARRL